MNSPVVGDLEALQRSVAALKTKLASLATRTYRGTDATGLVAAEVSSTGAVSSVDVSGQAIRDLTASALGTACVEAILAARVALGRQAAELAATSTPPAAGPDAPAVAAELRRAAEGMA
jgi:DNA-binding protein YbaB